MTGRGVWSLGELVHCATLLGGMAIGGLGMSPTACAGDWPQILGPNRDGHAAKDERVANAWPNDGPRVVWERAVGRGFASVSVAGGTAVLFHREGDEQAVEALDAATGKRLWRHALPTRYVSTISEDDGPRASPVIHDGRIYCLGADGELFCLDLDSGKQIWLRHVAEEFAVPESYFGAGSTPLVEDGKLLVNVGGRRGAGIVALRLDDGRTVWQTNDDPASYAAPIATTVDGARHAIFVTRYHVVSLDPADGKERFRFAFGKRGPTVNAAVPIVCDGNLFVTASYGIGAVMAKIEKDRAEPIWNGVDAMASQYTTCVYLDGALYGCDGRADQPPAHLRAIDARTGRVLWSEDGFGVAHVIAADGKCLALKDDGTLVLFEPAKDKFKPLATVKVLEGSTRAIPALAAGRLCVRDSGVLRCLDVGRK